LALRALATSDGGKLLSSLENYNGHFRAHPDAATPGRIVFEVGGRSKVCGARLRGPVLNTAFFGAGFGLELFFSGAAAARLNAPTPHANPQPQQEACMTHDELNAAVKSFLLNELGNEDPTRVGLLLVSYGLDFMTPALTRVGAAAVIDEFVQTVMARSNSAEQADHLLAQALQVRH
jgi:hypothetical protein